MVHFSRLTVGWVWETVLADAFDLMGGTSSLKPVQRVFVEVAFAAVIIAIVLCVHLYVRDWASDGLLEEQQRTKPPAASQTSMQPSTVTI